MLLTNNRLTSIPVLSLQTGTQLGQTTQPIIDPRQLQVVALYCAGPHVDNKAVLHTSDIREVSTMGFIVDGADSLMAIDGLVRLQEVINYRFELLGKKVYDTHKRKLGRVEGYSIDSESFFIMKIHVQQPLFKNFLTGGMLIIDRTQIIEVNDKRIVVKAADVKAGATERTQILQNPFRAQPQPDSSHIDAAKE